MKNFSKNIILWIVIGLLLVALFNLFQNSSSTNTNSEQFLVFSEIFFPFGWTLRDVEKEYSIYLVGIFIIILIKPHITRIELYPAKTYDYL